MRRYSEAVKADVRRRMWPPHRQSVAEISQELGILAITLYKWRKAWACRWMWSRPARRIPRDEVRPRADSKCVTGPLAGVVSMG
jgi:transposase-like protein